MEQKGKLVGSGRIAEVFEFGEKRVIKSFRKAFMLMKSGLVALLTAAGKESYFLTWKQIWRLFRRHHDDSPRLPGESDGGCLGNVRSMTRIGKRRSSFDFAEDL